MNKLFDIIKKQTVEIKSIGTNDCNLIINELIENNVMHFTNKEQNCITTVGCGKYDMWYDGSHICHVFKSVTGVWCGEAYNGTRIPFVNYSLLEIIIIDGKHIIEQLLEAGVLDITTKKTFLYGELVDVVEDEYASVVSIGYNVSKSHKIHRHDKQITYLGARQDSTFFDVKYKNGKKLKKESWQSLDFE